MTFTLGCSYRRTLRKLTALALLTNVSFTEAVAAEPLTLTYKDRSVDSAPYYYAFPYRIELASIEYGKLYFSRHVEGEGKRLFVTNWDPHKTITLDSTSATKVTDIDLDTINFWGKVYNKRLNGLVVTADDDKAERINLWVFPDGAAAPKRVTDVDYVYNFTQSKDHSRIYYTARYGASDADKGCLEELSVQDDGSTGVRQLICDDNSNMPAKINWWTDLRADAKHVIFPALKDGDRNKQELYAYDLTDGTVFLLFEGHGKSWVTVQEHWGDETQALFSTGRELYRYDFETREATLLRTFERALSGFVPAGKGDTPAILVTTETPFETNLELLKVEPTQAKTLSEATFKEDVWLANGYDGMVLVGKFSPETFASFEMLTFAQDGTYSAKEAVNGLAEINAQLNRCDVERVQIPYKDASAVSPGAGTLEAFIYRPRDLPPIEDQKFIITAYYGGRNDFSSFAHLFCALGVTNVSPVVRGDWRYGSEFANSNDREKADAPIRDTITVARYLVDRFNIPDTRQIGTTGYSHGGWAAVRALSYPGPERLKFGFAISGGGFYDLPAVVDPEKSGETNIHGWFDKEFGTAKQQDLLKSFSPSTYPELIDAPVFLYHGERDTRVSVNQAKEFADLLRKEGKPYNLIIVPDQGHSIRGPQNWVRIQQGMLDMIEGIPTSHKR